MERRCDLTAGNARYGPAALRAEKTAVTQIYLPVTLSGLFRT